MDTANVPKDERRRKILREVEERYKTELMDDEERMLLFDRIKQLKRAIKEVREA